MNKIISGLLVYLLTCMAARSEVTSFTVLPSITDSQIKTFDTPHAIYVDRDIVEAHTAQIQDRHQLLIWLTGTNGGAATSARAFCTLAAERGYHVISLMYPDTVPATVCKEDDDPHAFESFRMAIIRGGSTNHIVVPRQESIENRLIALLRYLRTQRPGDDWAQFLTDDGTLKWEALAFAGQSQGGGHAALIGVKYPVARVICTGAPKDYSSRLNSPAAWYSLHAATPKRRFFVFNHVQDPKGCTPEQLLKNCAALGLTELGAPVDVTQKGSPYGDSHVLLTSFPKVTMTSAGGEGAKTAHTSVIASANADRFSDVWDYMLTSSVK